MSKRAIAAEEVLRHIGGDLQWPGTEVSLFWNSDYNQWQVYDPHLFTGELSTVRMFDSFDEAFDLWSKGSGA